MKRLATREGEDDGLGVTDALEELSDILRSSDTTTAKAASMIAAGEQLKEEKMEWWKERKELDDRLMELLERIDVAWLGGFKVRYIRVSMILANSRGLSCNIQGLLLDDDFLNPALSICFSEFRQIVENLLIKAAAGKNRIKPLPLDPELCRMILRLGPEPSSGDVEDILYYLMDAYQYAGCPIGYDEINLDSVSEFIKDASFYLKNQYVIADGI
jgi:separase